MQAFREFMVKEGALEAVFPSIIGASSVWENNPFKPTIKPGEFSGSLDEDFVPLQEHKILYPLNYPKGLIFFLRDEVPDNQNILARDSYTLLMTTTHFTKVLTTNGRASPSIIANWDFLTNYHDETPFYFKDFLLPENRELFYQMLDSYKVDLIIVDQTESEVVRQMWENDETLQKLFSPIYDSGGYIIYQVAD